jgi:CYTH domain-containing protein
MSEHVGKYARLELERRFVVAHPPHDIERERGWLINDRYITNTQLRLRRMEPINEEEAVFKLGQKQVPSPPDFSRMTITNIYLSGDEYDVLAALDALELRKRRYPYAHDGRPFCIDIFEGKLSGLVLAETSFKTAEERDQPLKLPAWVAREVSNDIRFTGGALASLTPEKAADLVRQSTGHYS